ncbi:MAG: restriction endonuclease subunit S [Bacteroidales bacterium]|nr:restriction endonuclease subunit S [Candidatus Cacconaster scatequi]
MDIPVPSIPEQYQILDELHLLTGIIDKQKAQLKELDTLAQAIFYDMFGDPESNEKGWECSRLGDLCNSDLGKTLNQAKDTGELRTYLCAINIKWQQIDLSTLKNARFEDDEIERYSVTKGDLLVCEGGDIGRSAIWDKDYDIQYQNALHRLRFNGKVTAQYCLFTLQCLKQRGVLDSKYGKGVTIKHLVKSSLLSIPIPVPPITIQQTFAQKIQSIESQKASINRSIAETQILFDYTMDKYFG